jgi:hypothetical protein
MTMTTRTPHPGRGFGYAGEMTVNHLQKRLQRLEQVLPRWPASVEQAKQRSLARLYVTIGELCDRREHPTVRAALDALIADTPGQRAQDLETLPRWSRAHPELARGTEGARGRITAKLDEWARRLGATPCTPTTDA